MPVLSERANVVVMADEAHRSQYAKFAQNITIGAAERDPDRLHRHSRRKRRPLHAAGVRRLRLGVPDAPGAGRPRDGPDLLRVASRSRWRSRTASELAEVEEVLEGEEEEAAAKLVTDLGEAREGRRRAGAPGAARRRRSPPLRDPLRGAAGQGDGRRLLAADRRRADRPAARALRRGGGRLRDLGQRDRRAGDLALPTLQARAEAARQDGSATPTTRCGSWSSRTCG